MPRHGTPMIKIIRYVSLAYETFLDALIGDALEFEFALFILLCSIK
jgi:hypothetical protein